jgi:hypothetical protein
MYVGDVSDVFKFAFLRALARMDRTLGIAWYYVPDGRCHAVGRTGGRPANRCCHPDRGIGNPRRAQAMARNGATASEIAAKFKTTTATIERKARALGISITGGRVPKVVTRDCHPAQGSATVSCLPLKARLASV